MRRSRGLPCFLDIPPHALRVPLLALLPVLLLVPAVGGAAGGAARFLIVPGPYVRKGPDAPVPAAARASIQGMSLSVEYLDPAARAEFVRLIDPRARDPFAATPGQPQRYTAFRVEFDNRSASDVTFQPGNVVLMTDREEQQSPIDLTDVYRSAAVAASSNPQALMDRTAPLIFDLSTIIPQGGRIARLLVFGPLPGKWKELRLNFAFLQIGAETHSLTFPFHKQAVPD